MVVLRTLLGAGLGRYGARAVSAGHCNREIMVVLYFVNVFDKWFKVYSSCMCCRDSRVVDQVLQVV